MSFSGVTDDFLTTIRRRAFLAPVGGMVDAEIVDLLNQERRSTIAELIREAAPSFFRTSVDFTVVAATDLYRIPTRAMMAGFEQIVLRGPSGYEEEIVQLDASDRLKYSRGARDINWPGRFAAILEAEHIRIVPAPSQAEAGWTLRMYYHRTMSDMVMAARAMSIASPNSDTKTNITAAGSETVAAGLQTAGSLVDFVRGAGMYAPIYTDLVVAGYTFPVFTIATSSITPTDLATYVAGGRRDYVCLAQETVYPEVPQDVWPALISATAVQVLKSQKDFQHASAEEDELEKRLIRARRLLTPRFEEDEAIINHNSILRRGWGMFR